jgi:cobalamin biosynthesis protein CobT
MAGSESVFKQRWERPGLTTDVVLLIDHSGSMSHAGTDKVPREVHAARCAAVLSSALNKLHGVSFAVYGFSTTQCAQGSVGGEGLTRTEGHARTLEHSPYLRTIKAFDHRLNSETKARIASSWSDNNTPDAASIKACADLLRRRGATRRVVMVLTDGRGDNGVSTTLAAIDYAGRAGVEVIGIGIGRNVVHCYPTSAIVMNPADLTGQAMSVLVNKLSAKYAA